MFRDIPLALVLVALALGVACSTKSQFVPINAVHGQCQALIRIGDITDSSGYTPGKDDPRISPADSMRTALRAELTKKGLLSEAEAAYVLDIEILGYAPGSAFGRWLLPGVGATKLRIQSTLRCAGIDAAHIPVDRSIAAGGAFTIGAWEYIFTDVSERLVHDLETNIPRK